MEELYKIYKDAGQDFVNDLLHDYVIVTEKLSGSSFAFEQHGDTMVFFKGTSHKPINLVDRTMMMYYEPAIAHIEERIRPIKTAIPAGWRFCFQYFVHNEPGVIRYSILPKNNLVLTHIHVKGESGKTAKIIDDPRVIRDWAAKMDVTPLQPFFAGHLTPEQMDKIREFISIPSEDQEELFGTSSFAAYVLHVLNPGVTATTLHGDLLNPIDSLVFKFIKAGSGKTVSAKIIDPYTKTLMREKQPVDIRRAPADMNEIILLDLLAFIEERGIKKSDVLAAEPDARYIELVSTLFNEYVGQNLDSLKGVSFDNADFAAAPEFGLNLDMIANGKTKTLIQDYPNLGDLYKVMLGSLRKKRDPLKAGSVMTPSVIEDFNKLVDKISGITQREESGEFKTFEDYLRLKTVNESVEDAADVIYEERVLNYKQFVNLGRISLHSTPGPIVEALNVPHKEQGKKKVNIIVGRFQPFTLGHAKVFKQIHDQNGLPVVVFTVRGKKPDPEKSPFSEELQQAMFAKMQREYPFLEAMYVAPSAAIDTLYSMLRPAYEPILWGYGTDRKKQYDFMINKPEYREQLGADPSFSGYEIKRADEDVSASKVREAIMLDDKKTFEKMTPKSIHDMWETLQDVLSPVSEDLTNDIDNDHNDVVQIDENKNMDFSAESTKPGTVHNNSRLINLLDEDPKKMDLYKSFSKNIPKGQIAESFIDYVNSLNEKETLELVKALGSLKSPDDLTVSQLYGNRKNAIGRLFDLSARGTGKGELAIAWLIQGAEIQGGVESYDVNIKGKKYEVKDWSKPDLAKSPILTGVKSKVSNFEFWREIVDTIRRLDKLTGYTTGGKFAFSSYFSSNFVNVVEKLLQQQSVILSGEVGKERLGLLKEFYAEASNVKDEVAGYTNVILRGPNARPLELSILPLSETDASGSTVTFTKAEQDQTLTYIITELRRLKYVRNPNDLEKDMQDAVNQITEGITYIVFRRDKINIVPPGGFRPDSISISSLKFIEKDL